MLIKWSEQSALSAQLICFVYKVFEGDGLPNKICHPCRYQLDKSYTFRKKCENSDLKLRQHLKDLQEKLGTDISQLTSETIDEEGKERDAEGGKGTSEEMELQVRKLTLFWNIKKKYIFS